MSDIKSATTEELLRELAQRGDMRCDACCGRCSKPETKCMCGGVYNRNRGDRR